MATVVVCTHCGLRYETALSAKIVSLIGRCERCRRRTLTGVEEDEDAAGGEADDEADRPRPTRRSNPGAGRVDDHSIGKAK